MNEFGSIPKCVHGDMIFPLPTQPRLEPPTSKIAKRRPALTNRTISNRVFLRELKPTTEQAEGADGHLHQIPSSLVAKGCVVFVDIKIL